MGVAFPVVVPGVLKNSRGHWIWRCSVHCKYAAGFASFKLSSYFSFFSGSPFASIFWFVLGMIKTVLKQKGHCFVGN
jgi:hypothetical protein